MQPAEFERLCESVYGKYWRRPAARALGRDPKMMRRYATGDTVVPDDVAQALLRMAQVDPAAELIKGVLVRLLATPGGRVSVATEKRGIHERAHVAAIEIVDTLNRAGLLQG
jgi:hypothetical protein